MNLGQLQQSPGGGGEVGGEDDERDPGALDGPLEREGDPLPPPELVVNEHADYDAAEGGVEVADEASASVSPLGS